MMHSIDQARSSVRDLTIVLLVAYTRCTVHGALHNVVHGGLLLEIVNRSCAPMTKAVTKGHTSKQCLPVSDAATSHN